MSRNQKMKEIFNRRDAVIVPGVANALFARAVADAGFEALYVSGAGITNMRLGAPDLGFIGLWEIADTLFQITEAVDLPVIVDADTGFGSPINTVRTVRTLERAGASAVHIEDQEFPKKCGHFGGKRVIPAAEMVQKIKAATDARQDQDFQIIARTDAAAVTSFADALDRAEAYIEAGADVTFVEAPKSCEELAEIPRRLKVPQLANMVFGGQTPEPGRAALAKMGFSVVIYANALLQASLRASHEVLKGLSDEGSLAGVSHRLATFEERQAAVDKTRWDALEVKYS